MPPNPFLAIFFLPLRFHSWLGGSSAYLFEGCSRPLPPYFQSFAHKREPFHERSFEWQWSNRHLLVKMERKYHLGPPPPPGGAKRGAHSQWFVPFPPPPPPP
eukprot:Sspe_Gene.63921::Locus_37188_Transcript_1_1_Confidence_1.000_Length_382::g.63921::m.63921